MQKIRNLFKHEGGFTLIELLVVIAVLGILAAIAIPRISGVTDEARKSEMKATASTIRSTLELAIASGDADEIAITTGAAGTADITLPAKYNLSIDISEYGIDGTNSNDTDATDNSYDFRLTREDWYINISDTSVGVATK